MHNYFGKLKSSFITHNLSLRTIFDSQTAINKNFKLNNYASTGVQTRGGETTPLEKEIPSFIFRFQ